MIIGITGGSGTGKSSIARMLGFDVIDADKLYHELLAVNTTLQAELTEEFGTCDREGLAKIVFADRKELRKLNTITFKYSLAAIESKIPPGGDVVIDAPLLFESGLAAKCDVTVAVLASKDVRIKRIMERDGLTSEQAQTRINAQKSNDFFINNADIVIQNNDDDLPQTVSALKAALFEK